MTCSAEKKSLPGPHHCSALGNSLVGIVFSALKKEAENNQGILSMEDLMRLEEAFGQVGGVMSPLFIDTYNFCMSSSPTSNSTPFQKEDPLFFYLRVRTNKIVSALFARQLQYGASRWRAAFCRQLAQFVRETTVQGIDDELTKIYFDLGRRQGRELTANDIRDDARGNQTLTTALRELTAQLPKQPELEEKLLSMLNDGIRDLFPDATEVDTLVTEKQVKVLLSAMEQLAQIDWPVKSDCDAVESAVG